MRQVKLIMAALLAMSPLMANADLISWSIDGPGATSAVENHPGNWDLSYNLNPAGFSTVQWDVTSNAITKAGAYTFDWNYSGFHAFFRVTAFLISSDGTTLVNVGPENCCTAPSAGFNYSGSYMFTGVNVGDVIGFSMGGSNFDSNNTLRGTLNLQQIPEPGTLALLGIGLAGLGLARRRKKI